MSVFDAGRQTLRRLESVDVSGRVAAVRGLTIHVADFSVPVGSAASIVAASGLVEGRVIGFDDQYTLVMPVASLEGIRRGDVVRCSYTEQTVPVGRELLGRVIDALGRPIDGRGPLAVGMRRSVWPEPLAPMARRCIDESLATGICAIDTLLTVGCGQRVGVFSPSGTGKSVLLGMIARHARADVLVVALIGERGREVRHFVETHLQDRLSRSVVVAATSDEPPLVRVQAAATATAVAEYFRDEGRNVLLLMDSVTRLAAAQRQIGLAAGEPPTAQGYTPSVFSLLPELLERAGRTQRGSITGLYTALAEDTGVPDPIAEAVRAVADGHIVLSPDMARRGRYPAVDVPASVSRLMDDVADAEHRAAAATVRTLIADYRSVQDLIDLGAYHPGSNAAADRAVAAMPDIEAMLTQDSDAACNFESAKQVLIDLAARYDAAPLHAAQTNSETHAAFVIQ